MNRLLVVDYIVESKKNSKVFLDFVRISYVFTRISYDYSQTRSVLCFAYGILLFASREFQPSYSNKKSHCNDRLRERLPNLDKMLLKIPGKKLQLC